MTISAFLRRHIIYPLWTYKDQSNQLKFLKDFERLQWLDPQELQKIQFENLRKVIIHAYENVPYYKKVFDDMNFNPLKFYDPSQIRQLPILTKEHIQTNIGQLMANGYKKESMLEFKTGGSTGKSLTVYADLGYLDKALASGYLCMRWAGWDLGDPVGRVWGNPPLPKSIKEKLRNILIQTNIFLDTMDLNESSMREFIGKWEKVKPVLLLGHSHSLYQFSKFLKEEKIFTVKPKGIISTSMMLLPSERKVIEEAFNMQVTDMYGCEEVGLIACECDKHEGLHLNILNHFIEFIKQDGSIAMPGEEGNIVVTCMTNYGMPLIRYRIEDVGILSDHLCSCGRGLPLMDKVTGRVADFLVKKDGSLVQGVSLIERTLTRIKGLSQMQIIQEGLNEFDVNIVNNQQYSENSRAELVTELKAIFGTGINIRIHLSNRIDQEKSGKYRFSICKIKNS